MDQVRQWWHHAASMTLEALGVWWRCLPKLLTAYVTGWIFYELCLVIAPVISGRNAWVALGVVSLGFVGRTASSLVANEVVIRGVLSKGVLTKTNPITLRDMLTMGAIIAGAYLIRRIVDFVHEKTDFRPLGLVAALIEGFFMMLLLLTGRSLLITLSSEYHRYRVSNWIDDLRVGWGTALSSISHYIPEVITRLWSLVISDLWPLFKGALFQPLLWLAVAALVFGSHVLSFAEMWRKGEPLSVHLDERNKIVLDKRAARKRASVGRGRGRAVTLEVQEALFGDLDDKYLPTLQALRLVLRGGVVFLSAYIVVYSTFSALVQILQNLVLSLLGGRDEVFWVAWLKLIMVVLDPVGSTLTLALLASAFAATLRIFGQHADRSAIGDEDLESKTAPSEAEGAEPGSLDRWTHLPTGVNS